MKKLFKLQGMMSTLKFSVGDAIIKASLDSEIFMAKEEKPCKKEAPTRYRSSISRNPDSASMV